MPPRINQSSALPAPFRVGGVATVALPPWPAAGVLGDQVRGQPILIGENQCNDDLGGPFEIVLGIPQQPTLFPGQPLNDLVAVVDFGEARGFGWEQNLAGAAFQARTLEVDWIHGAVIAVPGSMIRVSARWDRYSVGVLGAAPPAIALTAFIAPYGTSHGLNAQRTYHHFATLGAGATTAVLPLPGYIRDFRLASGLNGGSWQIDQITRNGTILDTIVFAAGTSPRVPLVNGVQQLNVTNQSANPAAFHITFGLGL